MATEPRRRAAQCCLQLVTASVVGVMVGQCASADLPVVS